VDVPLPDGSLVASAAASAVVDTQRPLLLDLLAPVALVLLAAPVASEAAASGEALMADVAVSEAAGEGSLTVEVEASRSVDRADMAAEEEELAIRMAQGRLDREVALVAIVLVGMVGTLLRTLLLDLVAVVRAVVSAAQVGMVAEADTAVLALRIVMDPRWA
jgi:hypothetical protein